MKKVESIDADNSNDDKMELLLERIRHRHKCKSIVYGCF